MAPNQYNTIMVESAGSVATVTLNRPDVHNAMSEELITELTQCIGQLGAEDGIRVIIITGAGKSFCAGADLNYMKAMAGFSREQNVEDADRLAGLFHAVNSCPKAVIGRINGAAIGGGVGLVAACDIAVASERAKFAFSEVKLGIVPAVISPFVVPKIGVSAARELFITGERFTAAKAKDIGLVHDVVPPEELDAAVGKKADMVLGSGPNAVTESKRLIGNVWKLDYDALRAETSEWIADLRGSDEGKEGISSFLEKREPKWRS